MKPSSISPNLNIPPLDLFIGKSTAMKNLVETLRAMAPIDVPVLIQGESGTGKELCVRWLHHFAHPKETNLVKISCAALPQALVESELFGYEKGAFTGATQLRKGKVEQADHGTLFLDEIGSLELPVQVKLLRFLQDNAFSRIGGHEVLQLHTRLVATANRPLKDQVAEGSFRLDLLYRINAVSLTMPPLRERAEDIPDLVAHFLRVHATAFGTKPQPIPREIMRGLERYHWPGNFRQLENMIRSFVVLGSMDALIPEESPYDPVLKQVDVSTPASLKSITREATLQLERHIIMRVLRANGWNRRTTARWLKISYRSLLYKLRSFGMLEEGVTPPPPKRPKSAPASAALAAPGPRLARER